MLLNIIHPYTYKQLDDTLHLGPVPEYAQRDLGVAALVTAVLNLGEKVIWHRFNSGSTFKMMLEDSALSLDPLYNFMFDDRIKTVVTTPFGTPRPDIKPANIPEQAWKIIERTYTSDSELRDLHHAADPILFIGGFLECCLTNIACHVHDKYTKENKPPQRSFYIPELCVSGNQDQLEKVTLPQFKKRDIQALSMDQARLLLQ